MKTELKFCLHVTSSDVLASILKNGLRPSLGPISDQLEASPAIFMFPSWEDMLDASWLYESWPHESEPALLCVDTQGFELWSDVPYEVFSMELISPNRITVLAPGEMNWAGEKKRFLDMGGSLNQIDQSYRDSIR